MGSGHITQTDQPFGAISSEQKTLWAPLYESVLTIIGSTGVIIPLGDTNSEAANRTTCTTRGEEQAVFTYSEAVTSFDTIPTLLGPGQTPIISFNGTDEEADTPDATYWSRGTGVADSVFSVGAWVNITDTATTRTIFSKWQTAANSREYVFFIGTTEVISIYMRDESAAVNATRDTDTALTTGSWRFVVVTYDGGGGATAANGLVIYDNGAVKASTATNNALYVAMENTAVTPSLGKITDPTQYFAGSMAGGPLGPFFTQTQLSADAILRLYQLGRAALGV